jgi:dUTP pyrophosphatase
MAPRIETILKIYIPPQHNTLRMFYTLRANEHNERVVSDHFADSGFDLAVPDGIALQKYWGNKIPLGVHASMWSETNRSCDGDRDSHMTVSQAYYLYPRSSISKTPMRLANSVGIIDRGYRGEIMAVLDIVDHNKIPYNLNAHDRHFQICHPSLNPFKVIIVNTKDELGITNRGNGGFGSTGV